MKIKIDNFPNRLECNTYTRYMERKYGDLISDCPENNKFENFLENLETFIQTCYTPINYFLDKRTQKIKIRIDPWDTWSMDYTLAPIILPMLVQLKETKCSAPFVDNKDVPKELRVTKKQIDEYNIKGEVDPKHFDRWDWVLNEMIYAFDCKANKDAVYMRFDVNDRDGMAKEQERISNGFRLFGKYYESLWD